jgi:hypothetical protein
VGEGFLERTAIYQDTRLGSISQIVERSGADELAIVGTSAAVFLGTLPDNVRAVEFQNRAGQAELIEWPEGEPRYLDRGGGGWQTGALIGADGRRLWQPAEEAGMDDMAAGDLDGDGIPEFVVGYNGGGGVQLLDAEGRERWRRSDANVWHVEILDADGDGQFEIVHSNAAGQLTLRGADGEVLRRVEIEGYLSDFSVVRWPQGRAAILAQEEGRAEIFDFDGKTRLRLETPDTSRVCEVRGTPAHLGGGDYLVLVVSECRWDRTQVFVFDETGAPRYQEVADGDCRGLAAPQSDEFLLGCGSQVVRYTLARQPPGSSKPRPRAGPEGDGSEVTPRDP